MLKQLHQNRRLRKREKGKAGKKLLTGQGRVRYFLKGCKAENRIYYKVLHDNNLKLMNRTLINGIFGSSTGAGAAEKRDIDDC